MSSCPLQAASSSILSARFAFDPTLPKLTDEGQEEGTAESVLATTNRDPKPRQPNLGQPVATVPGPMQTSEEAESCPQEGQMVEELCACWQQSHPEGCL